VLNRARLLGVSLPIAAASYFVVAMAAAPSGPAAVTQARLNKGTEDTALLATYGGSYSEQRFSPLKKINDGKVKDLGLEF
jgi:quinohemoprotein ethanol dehydrogenase